MATEKRILKTEAGVLLKEVRLRGDAGLAAVAYTVSSQRTPEVHSFASASEAGASFDAEVALCRDARSSLT
jgi:hypothetical protein